MTQEAIFEKQHGDFTIKVYHDYYYDTDFLHDDYYGELHLISRRYKHDVSWSDNLDSWQDVIDKYWVIAGTFGEHSGVWLRGSGVLLNDDIAYAIKYELKEAKKDLKKYFDASDVMYNNTLEQFDNYDAIVLVDKNVHDKKSITKSVSTIWDYHDDILRGNVYSFCIFDKDGESLESVYGYVGDFETSGILDDAASFIPADATKYYNEKYKSQAQAKLDEAQRLLSNITV